MLFLTSALSAIVIANINPTSDGVGSPLNPEEFSMAVTEVTGHPGDQVTMSVTGSWDEDITGFGIWLKFNCDPKDINVTEIDFEGCVYEDPSCDPCLEVTESNESIDIKGIILFDSPVSVGDGALFNIIIEINETAPPQVIPVVIIGGGFSFYLTLTGQIFPEITDGQLKIVNDPPEILSFEGPSVGILGYEITFIVNGTDPDGHQVKYGFDWNNDDIIEDEDWTDFVDSGIPIEMIHIWIRDEGENQVKVKAMDIFGAESAWSDIHIINITNNPPETPSLTGPTEGMVGQELIFVANTTDPDDHQVKYGFIWGDGEFTWTDYNESGVAVEQPYAWSTPGIYEVKVQANDFFGASSNLSDILIVTIIDSTPELVIESITSGKNNITAIIKNIGDAPATNVEWIVSIEGGLMLFADKANGTIETLAVGASEEVTLKGKSFLGIGIGLGILTELPTITVTAVCNEGSSAEESEDARIFFSRVTIQ